MTARSVAARSVAARRRVSGAVGRTRHDRGRLGIAVAAVVGAVLRLAAVAYAARPPVGLVDPGRYAGLARSIGAGQGMVDPLTGQPTAYYPPGYPYVLGGVDAVITRTPLPDDLALVAGLVQVVLGVAAIVATGTLARRLVSPAAGVVAAAIVAVYPNLVLHTAALLTETLSITLLLGFLVVLVPPGTNRWPGPLDRGRMAGAGLLFGALLLVRPVTAGVVGAAAVAWLVAGEGWRRTLQRTGIVVVVGLLCLVPWTVRNAVRMDAFVPLSTNTGDNLCIGHAPGATGAFRTPEECETGTGVQGGTEDEISSNQEKASRALRFAREGWADQPGLIVDRFWATVNRDDDSLRALQSYGFDQWAIGDDYAAKARVLDWSWFLVGLVGLVGLVRLAWGRRADQLLVPLAGLAVLASPLLTFGDSRFKVPIVPLMAIGVAALVTRSGPAPRDG